MEGQANFSVIKVINKTVVHRICSGQVISDLSSAVKELVENSLDAGASNIEINLKEYGEEFFKVLDNGCGISPNNFQALGRKYHTSKITNFSDLHSLTTFGFRGEALSSLCALGNVSVETRTKNEAVGTLLTFDHAGEVTAERKTARQVGTTVTVEKLFSTLPVRNKDFSRNIKREFGKLTSLLNAYALIAKGVRFLCTNITSKNSKLVVLKTQGSISAKENIITVLGLSTFQCLEPLSICISDICTIEGFLSKPYYGSGRNLGDRQFFFINDRPVDMPKVSKLLNEVYKTSNAKQFPIAIMNFIMPATLYDVNVTPDKRKVFISDEGSLMLSLRSEIEKIYSPHEHSYSINCIKKPNEEADVFLPDDVEVDAILPPKIVPKPLSHRVDDQMKEAASIEQHMDADMPIILQISNEDTEMDSEPAFNNCPPKKLLKSSFDDSDMFVNHCNHRLNLPAYAQLNTAAYEKVPSTLGKMDTACNTNFLQSRLDGFFLVNKRKHNDSCSMLSEMPLLRDAGASWQIRTGTEKNISASRTNFANSKDSTFISEADVSSNTVEGFGSLQLKACNSDSNKDDSKKNESALPSEAALKNSSGKIIEIKFEELSTLSSSLKAYDLNKIIKASSSQKTFPLLQFSIQDLGKRRNKRITWLYSRRFKAEGQIQSCYSAATLVNSQSETEGKENSLAAAVMELERFFRKEDFGRMEVIGQFNLGFIIGKLDQDLFIVDQHAADEKYNFESISRLTILNQQPLLKPIRLELSPEEEIVASMNMDIIRKNGFLLMEDMHASPSHRFLLKAVPFSKNTTFGVEDLKELISTLADGEGDCSVISSFKMDTADSICPSRLRSMFASRACRMSVMIGDSLTKSDMQKAHQPYENFLTIVEVKVFSSPDANSNFVCLLTVMAQLAAQPQVDAVSQTYT